MNKLSIFNKKPLINLLILLISLQICAEGSQEDLKEPGIQMEQTDEQEQWVLNYPIDLEDDSPLQPRIPVTLKEPAKRLYLVGEDIWTLMLMLEQMDRVCGFSDFSDLNTLDIDEVLLYNPDLIISRYQLSGYLRGGLSARGIQTYHIGPLSSRNHGLYHIKNLGIICNETENTERLTRNFYNNWKKAGNNTGLWNTYLNYIKTKRN